MRTFRDVLDVVRLVAIARNVLRHPDARGERRLQDVHLHRASNRRWARGNTAQKKKEEHALVIGPQKQFRGNKARAGKRQRRIITAQRMRHHEGTPDLPARAARTRRESMVDAGARLLAPAPEEKSRQRPARGLRPDATDPGRVQRRGTKAADSPC